MTKEHSPAVRLGGASSLVQKRNTGCLCRNPLKSAASPSNMQIDTESYVCLQFWDALQNAIRSTAASSKNK